MYLLREIALLGAAQGVMLSLAILTIEHGNRGANRVLSAFIGVLSLRLLVIALEYQAADGARYPGFTYALLHLSYAIGPLLYFYTRLLVEPQWRLRPRQLLHFLPVVVAAMLLTPGGPVLGSDVSGYASFEALPAALQSRVARASAPVFVSLAAYCLIALRLLRRYRGAIRPQFSALEFINLDWLRALVWFCLLIAAGSLSSELYRGITGAVTGPRTGYSVLFSVVLIYYIGLMGLRQPLIFDQGERPRRFPSPAWAGHRAPDEQEAPEVSEGPAPDLKYQKSGLDAGRADRLWDNLCLVMTAERPHLEPGLTLADLARRVGTRPNYLSQVINSRAGENFFDFINRHRIDCAKEMLLGDRKRSIAEVAMASGFNSQNVFNNHFRRYVGQTPTEFRRKFGRQLPVPAQERPK